MTDAAALRKAKALRTEAERAEKTGRAGAAYVKSLEAYELVQGRSSDAACQSFAAELRPYLERLATAANQKVGGGSSSYRPKGKPVVIE